MVVTEQPQFDPEILNDMEYSSASAAILADGICRVPKNIHELDVNRWIFLEYLTAQSPFIEYTWKPYEGPEEKASDNLIDKMLSLGRRISGKELTIDQSYVVFNQWHQSLNPVSLNKQAGDTEGSGEIGDFIVDPDAVSVEEEGNSSVLREDLEKILSELPKRDRDVLRKRFGFDGKGMTLEEVGREYGITRERVRQVELKALKKLRVPNVVKRLEGTLDY